MRNLIRLRPWHQETVCVTHHLLENLDAPSEDELQTMAMQVANGAAMDELCMSLRLCLKNNVGQYMRYWPQTRPLADDMVSVGFLALVKLMHDLTPELLKDRSIFLIANRRIQDAIEQFLNKNIAITSPGLTRQKEVVKDGGEPIYHFATSDEFEHPHDAGDEWMRDYIDAFRQIKHSDDIDRALLNPLNWGRPLQELADELSVSVTTIHRRREKLHKQCMEMIS